MTKRKLTQSEIDLISWMIKDKTEAQYIVPKLNTLMVEEMDDGGMGSLRVVSEENRVFLKDLAEVELYDQDGVLLFISVYLDNNNDFFELDVWKADYSPLIKFPDSPNKISY